MGTPRCSQRLISPISSVAFSRKAVSVRRQSSSMASCASTPKASGPE
ncbi:hypothetical protein ACLESO_23560 [Pyxidicoccus sp. 3LG]